MASSSFALENESSNAEARRFVELQRQLEHCLAVAEKSTGPHLDELMARVEEVRRALDALPRYVVDGKREGRAGGGEEEEEEQDVEADVRAVGRGEAEENRASSV